MSKPRAKLSEPIYEHDCTTCLYLGSDAALQGDRLVNQVDVYIHLNPSGNHTIIRRYSSHPPDYVSFKPHELNGRHYVPVGYRSAVALAQEKGYLPDDLAC
jgi:hypothetical protein